MSCATQVGWRRIVLRSCFLATSILAFEFGERRTCGSQNNKYSWSIAEATKRGTLLFEVEIAPIPLMFNNKAITFEAAWLEKLPDGTYALCFRIDEGKDIFKGKESPFFVRDNRGAGFNEHHGKGWLQFIERLESGDLSNIRASLVTDFKEERKRNIRFVSKRK